MSGALRKIAGNASKHNCTIIFINQLRQKVRAGAEGGRRHEPRVAGREPPERGTHLAGDPNTRLPPPGCACAALDRRWRPECLPLILPILNHSHTRL
jgi:hypothetical protein